MAPGTIKGPKIALNSPWTNNKVCFIIKISCEGIIQKEIGNIKITSKLENQFKVKLKLV